MKRWTLRILGFAFAFLFVVFSHATFANRNVQRGVPSESYASSTSAVAASSTGFLPPTPTKKTDCIAVNGLPDIACTPGAVFPDATVEHICTSGYSQTVRNVPASEKEAVYAEYGIVTHQVGEYEVDHLISLELGGSNDIANLWPEAATPTPGFHEKDKVENYLHAQVCAGKISLSDAQHIISTNWLSVYRQGFSP